jgi:uncharacterized heparinase superfamily protein
LSNLGNYFHTLRYLRPIQVVGRIRFKLLRPRPDLRAPPPRRISSHPYITPILAPVSMLGPNRFRFLNLVGTCSAKEHWAGNGRSQLWAYNLNYFDDLNAVNAAERHSWHDGLIERWIEENPPGAGIGWDSYPVSRRLVNWIKWSLAGNLLTGKAYQSLAVQARWLDRRIELHLQGNHVFANAKALIHAGLFFEGKEAERWLRRGLSLLRTELAEQVLADGGHFERSPMYHAGFVEDLLDIIGIALAYGRPIEASWEATMVRMMTWLGTMSHPDGEIAFFNDAAFGISPAAAQLRAYAVRLTVKLDSSIRRGLDPLVSSGYLCMDLPPFFIICDVAPIGPDHLPAHAHADTLSFEMSYKARRVFVNSGTSEYGLGEERQRQRGTAAHNTVVVDGEDSSEVWAGFRVARRARARLLRVSDEDSVINLVGEHDGYRRLPGRNLHRRSWTLNAHQLLIEDTVEGPFRSANCYFHLHPEIDVSRLGERDLQLVDSRDLRLVMLFEGAASIEVFDSTWHSEFGLATTNRCIVVRFDGPRLITRIRGSGLN